MSRDPISDATSSILIPSLEVQGFKLFTNRITARIVDDILQFLSVQVSRRGTRWFRLHYASICLFRPRDVLPLQPGGTIVRASEPKTFLQRLFRSRPQRVGFDGTGPESANASMSEAMCLADTQAMPFFAQTRTTLLLYDRLLKEQWGSEHHLLFEMGCCLARLQRFIEAEKILRRAVYLYEKDGRDWCNIEIGRVNSLRRAIQQGRSDECLIGWTRESVSNLALDALVTGNPAQQPVAPEP
jgi:hypothetical protein